MARILTAIIVRIICSEIILTKTFQQLNYYSLPSRCIERRRQILLRTNSENIELVFLLLQVLFLNFVSNLRVMIISTESEPSPLLYHLNPLDLVLGYPIFILEARLARISERCTAPARFHGTTMRYARATITSVLRYKYLF